MRHVAFWLFMVIATTAAMLLALPLAMSECQLNYTQPEIDTCFARNAWGFRLYAASYVGFLSFSIVLYTRASRWAFPSILQVAVGPFCVALAIATFYFR
jgi:hypothetical protein